MRRFDAVICDIDGCLGPESHAPLDAHALAKIAEHNQLAIDRADRPLMTLCSGRPQPYAEAICRLIGNSRIPCVAEMGVWLYDPSDNTFQMDPAITPDHLAAVRAATGWIERNLIPRGVVIQPGKTASISLWHPDTPFLMSLKPALADTFAKERWPLRVSNTVAWLNCDLQHVNKDTGIARLIARTGLTKDRLAGIGDTMGDLAIRRCVAWFGCPANAVPELKAQADYVASGEEVEGVLEILGQLCADHEH